MPSCARRLFGIETEYAVFGVANDGSRLRPHVVADHLLERAVDRLVHLPGVRYDLFLENGARFYVDEGSHPEMCTPECEDPKDVVRFTQACELILAGLAAPAIEDAGKTYDVYVHAGNVDYSGSRTTWGCHESYMHKADSEALARHLVPHLVSRPIYTGAGGFVATSDGIDFTLSPRTFHLVYARSGSSTHERGIFHGNKRPLCAGGYHRLHLLCGESLRSHTAAWLKIGVTALIVALIEKGVPLAEGVEPTAPLRAMRAFALDPTCTLRVKLRGGARASAIDIQRHYLAHVERHLGEEFMPAWAGEVWACWKEVLDRLAESPASLSSRLDWAIKLALYRSLAEQAGFSWSELRKLSRLMRSGARLPVGRFRDVEELRQALAAKGTLKRPRWRGPAFWAGRGVPQERLEAFDDLRAQLLELDARFGELGEHGVFTALDRSGALSHRVAGIDGIERARTQPPETGRAHLRGRVVRNLAGTAGSACAWSRIRRAHDRCWLDLSDPFETAERWMEKPTQDPDEIPF